MEVLKCDFGEGWRNITDVTVNKFGEGWRNITDVMANYFREEWRNITDVKVNNSHRHFKCNILHIFPNNSVLAKRSVTFCLCMPRRRVSLSLSLHRDRVGDLGGGYFAGTFERKQ